MQILKRLFFSYRINKTSVVYNCKLLKENSFQEQRKLKYTEANEGIHISSDLYSICEPKPPKSNRKKLISKKTVSEYEILYGIHPILLALQSRRRSFINLYYKNDILKKNEKANEIFQLCQEFGVPSHSVDKNKIIQLVGNEKVHQGVCLEASRLPFLVLEKLIQEKKLNLLDEMKGRYKLWLYLDQINDPMNLGAVLRTAYYLGVNKIFTSHLNSCPITNVVSKASAGVAEIVPVYEIRNIVQFINTLKENDWQIIASATQSNSTISIEDFQPCKNILLIVGNEGRGVSSEIENESEVLLTIPAHSGCSDNILALNVSVATSIILHSLLTKLKIQ